MEKAFWAKARRIPHIWIEPDAYLRYQPVIEWIKSRSGKPRVLELGSGDFGLSSFVDYPAVRTDIRFRRAFGPDRRVQCDARKLPFRDRSFDLVFSADLLEHVPPEARAAVIGEAARVSRKSVLMIFPCGRAAREQDLRLARSFESEKGLDMGVLKEHERFCFPEDEDVAQWVKALSGFGARSQVSASYNLKWRFFLVSAWLKGRARFVEWVMRNPLIQIGLHSGICYRRVIRIETV